MGVVQAHFLRARDSLLDYRRIGRDHGRTYSKVRSAVAGACVRAMPVSMRWLGITPPPHVLHAYGLQRGVFALLAQGAPVRARNRPNQGNHR